MADVAVTDVYRRVTMGYAASNTATEKAALSDLFSPLVLGHAVFHNASLLT